jgi:SNF2 family DNA or RNA helicase
MLNRSFLKNTFGSRVYQRGLQYYNRGLVQNLFYDEQKDCWIANVIGSEIYHVEISTLASGITHYCECPAHSKYNGCKHVVAVALEILEEVKEEPKREVMDRFLDDFYSSKKPITRPNTNYITDKMIKIFSNYMGGNSKEETPISSVRQPLKCEFTLKLDHYPYSHALLTLEMRVGVERLYVVKKLKDFVEKVEREQELVFTPNFIYDPSIHYFHEEDRKIIELLIEINRGENFFKRQNYYYGTTYQDKQKGMIIPPLFAERLLKMLSKHECKLEYGRERFFNIEWKGEETLPFTFHLDKLDEENFMLDLHFLQSVFFLQQYGYILKENQIYKLTQHQQNIIQDMKTIIEMTPNRTLPIERVQMDTFLSHVMPGLNQIGTLKITKEISDVIIQPPLQAKLYLDLTDERLYANLEYHYDEVVINPFDSTKNIQPLTKQILIRDMEKEQEVMNLIEYASFKYNGNELYMDDEEAIYTLLYDLLPKFEDKLNIYMTGSVRNILLDERQYPKVQVNLDHKENFLEINFDFDDISEEEIQNIIRSLIEKKRYYRLPSGAFVPLEEDSFSPISNLFTELDIKPEEVSQGKLKLPAFRSMQVGEYMNKNTGAKYNAAFRKLLQDIQNPDDTEFPLPTSLQANLREYQQVGFQWLKTLSHYRFGGILADDMGLGKTLQTISFLLSEHEENPEAKALVIAPASLIYNWESEFMKFAPSLKVLVVNGGKEERQEQMKAIPDVNVVVTSYPLIRQDIEAYLPLTFSTLVLDEAQMIKNDLTKTAKAVKMIQAGNRFALSGTPIENSLSELWSIFDAILPGFFPSKQKFSTLSNEQISKMSRPFILRRLKKDVLKELPEKIESLQMSELTKEQKQLYLGYLEKIQHEAATSIATDGFQKSRMKILAGLTRLRQLCCHPSLFIENYQGESGKLIQLIEMVVHAKESGQRMLIFSQFSSMLKIIKDELHKRGFDSFYLDGQTPSKERVEMADRFNNGEKEIFLISLKAGGTGLNLTGADTVILYDLWWNPAVEDQATGRAHRIGQKKVVQVFRLVAAGTIEEKIYSLQQKKKELIENIIQPGETLFNRLSEEEIRELLNV